jgi:hypothetical protein
MRPAMRPRGNGNSGVACRMRDAAVALLSGFIVGVAVAWIFQRRIEAWFRR